MEKGNIEENSFATITFTNDKAKEKLLNDKEFMSAMAHMIEQQVIPPPKTKGEAMNYKEELAKRANYYELKRRAILDTIRSLEVKREDSESIDWGEVNKNKTQQETIEYLIDSKFQNMQNDNLPIDALVRQAFLSP